MTILNRDSGYVQGYVVHINAFPEKDDLFKKPQVVASKILKRRNEASYDNFKEFKEDSKTVVFLWNLFLRARIKWGNSFCLQCFFARSESGVKRKISAHVVACLMDVSKIKRTSNQGSQTFYRIKELQRKI